MDRNRTELFSSIISVARPRSSMDRVTDFESGGCAFDPRRGHLIPMDSESSLGLIRLLLVRLERISAESYWAHRASGIRGALLRVVEEIENHRPVSSLKTKRLLQDGFEILRQAVGEYTRL